LPELTDLVYPAFLLLCWFLFGMYSPTAHNHGRWVAFLMPLALLVFLAVSFMLGISRLTVYPFFLLAGRKQRYEELVDLVKHPYLWGLRRTPSEADKGLPDHSDTSR